MARSTVHMNYDELNKLKEQIMLFGDPSKMDQFFTSCAKELAARLLAKVVKRTPVGDYTHEITVVAKRDGKKHKKGETYTKKVNPKSGKMGGTLRRGWTSETYEEAKSGKGKGKDVTVWANSLSVNQVGSNYIINVTNPVEYASYVEFGHRTPSHTGWVEGQFMLTISEKEIQSAAPQILEKKLEKWLKGCFK